ncbi:hypothetical protein ECZU41_49610 [Escherichia coli]|uniref:hypothetical protein n=1 Tax=Escherichia coli TaxID=562 RepID=UPI0013FF2B4A|nr:hypothetical protein [Escherichia coli]EFH5316825.1 hypothetical protein [Escherichia coli]MDX7315234.1 hypothetical protein [Escherichia coli]MWE31080.1 hypothetical protein [Escherichia coli]GHL34802.1 hypothetical protein ECZU26_56270 [Escherichia coli]GHM10293.1 hypothetical protein ECZU41_49610 [Escherichia coli]
MNYDEITKITAERISDYMTEAVNTDSIAVAEMGNDSNLLIVFYVQIMPDDFVMQLHRF